MKTLRSQVWLDAGQVAEAQRLNPHCSASAAVRQALDDYFRALARADLSPQKDAA